MADKFEGFRLGRKTIEHSRGSRPLAGVIARLESAAQIRERDVATDVRVLDGVVRQLLKKPVDDREVFLTISGPSFEWHLPIGLEDLPGARAFAAKVNAAAAVVAASGPAEG